MEWTAYFTVLRGTDGLDTAWIQEKTYIYVQYFDEEIYLKVAILKTTQVKKMYA